MKNRPSFPLVGILCLFSQVIVCQDTPMFEMPIYFEDAAGNRDTIVVGYDTSAVANNLNPQFGEVWIDTPFDSTFEVRVSHSDEWPYRTGKKVIEPFETAPDNCGASSWVEIMLSAKHFPITVSYDTALIHASACHLNMILSPDWQIFLQQFWWEAEVFYCMSNYDQIIDSSEYMIHPESNFGYLKYEFEVEGQGMKELPGYFWVVKWIGICQTLVGTDEIRAKEEESKIFPNPATDEISLELPNGEKVERIDFFDSVGRNVKSLTTSTQLGTERIHVGDLPAGFYAVSVHFDNRAPVIFKFVRQKH